MNNEEKIREILEENAKLKEELQATQDHLKRYTAPSNMKKYYENHKEEIKQRVKKYKSNNIVSPDVIKERNKKAYAKRKEKLKELENTENIN